MLTKYKFDKNKCHIAPTLDNCTQLIVYKQREFSRAAKT